MDISVVAGALSALSTSPLLLIGVSCAVFYMLGFFFYLLWAAVACVIFRDADMWTKLLPERNVWKGGRTAWVTGASSGIGLSLCKKLAQRGCRVVMSSRNMEDLQIAQQQVLEACAAKGVQRRPDTDILLLPFDITVADAVEAAVKRVEEWTDGQIDFLFNNAGIMIRGVFCSYEAAEKLIQVDLMGHIRLTKLVLPVFIKNKYGHLVFTNSMFSKVVPCGTEPYCVAKAGLISYAAALSREFIGSRNNIYTTSAVLGMVKTGLCTRALGPKGDLLTCDSAWMQPRIAEGQSPDFVADMMLRATSNRLQETWIANGFYLFFLYLQHYTPDLANWLLDLRSEALAAEIREEARELGEIAQRVRAQ